MVWNSQSRLGWQVSELGSPSASLLGTGILMYTSIVGLLTWVLVNESRPHAYKQTLNRQNVLPRQKIFSLWKNEQKYQEMIARFHYALQMSEATGVTETHAHTDLVCFQS